MSEPKVKERLLDAVRGLPEDATVEEGLRQAEAGETMSHEEAKRRILG